MDIALRVVFGLLFIPTDLVLTGLMEIRRVRHYPHPEEPESTLQVYEMGKAGADSELHVAVRPGLPPDRPGAGGVHHVAFRVADDAAQQGWLERLARAGLPNSGWSIASGSVASTSENRTESCSKLRPMVPVSTSMKICRGWEKASCYHPIWSH